MKFLTVQANLDKLDCVLDFINAELESNNCPMKVQIQIDIAVEELYVNIAHYAYGKDNPTEEGATATIGCLVENGVATISFEDGGIPYNPLDKPDPDINLDADKRKIGGLGIYMVKKSMDKVSYKYVDKKNILTIEKKFN